jgi:hypothetical protein
VWIPSDSYGRRRTTGGRGGSLAEAMTESM